MDCREDGKQRGWRLNSRMATELLSTCLWKFKSSLYASVDMALDTMA